ncbi:MAG: GFA family protein [Deltaproteobacteria bacterium]|nr:GFA family protein [Deltaproteobacteria bacterium]MBW2448686.1 GFA family protein [Deltaproteobacteria bacterium]
MKTIAVPGRCRCGRVTFMLHEEPLSFYLCHCTDCQAESGSAFGQSMHVRRKAIDSVDGVVQEHAYEGPSGVRNILTHCAECMTIIWGGRPDMPQVVGLNAGSLKDIAGLMPHGNMWTRSARPWVTFAPGPRFEQQPEDPLALVRAWQEHRSNEA